MRRTTMSERKQVFASNCKFQIKKHHGASNREKVTEIKEQKASDREQVTYIIHIKYKQCLSFCCIHKIFFFCIKID